MSDKEDKDIVDTDEEFVNHCKEATRHLTAINNSIIEDDELTPIEAMSFSLALVSVTCLGKTLADKDMADSNSSSNTFKWDDDHTFM